MLNRAWYKIKHVGIQGVLRLIVLICSLALVGSISYDTFVYNNPFYQSAFALKLQFWVCIFFMADLALEFCFTRHKARYIFTYLLLFIACIPYGYVLPRLGISLPKDIGYFVSFMPLIRSCYALAIVVSWFAIKASSKMFMTYMIILLSGVYLGSLGFYVCEINVNPDVRTYWDALWWSVMEAITIGCNIEAVTTGGKILSVIVGVLGLLIIPMFTVYVTNIVSVFHTVTTVAGAAATEIPSEGTAEEIAPASESDVASGSKTKNKKEKDSRSEQK